jgi:hypothetical protein
MAQHIASRQSPQGELPWQASIFSCNLCSKGEAGLVAGGLAPIGAYVINSIAKTVPGPRSVAGAAAKLTAEAFIVQQGGSKNG